MNSIEPLGAEELRDTAPLAALAARRPEREDRKRAATRRCESKGAVRRFTIRRAAIRTRSRTSGHGAPRGDMVLAARATSDPPRQSFTPFDIPVALEGRFPTPMAIANAARLFSRNPMVTGISLRFPAYLIGQTLTGWNFPTLEASPRRFPSQTFSIVS
ncbi:hypothetical protein Q4F19_02400 [Sphingomonas sp. BIUV-7]|uniref:Uncharacterized protein n=1 Tax=Sphingomonas natans TaxID=3063330 RepID=A0ABT8Y4I5_9SPHN|nr:hypothetical protein [Sphingomonas sp. BIUV-7]MDO6413224.1 hypothetical protein [Sphingomonas sp. BIUV-7]